MTTGIKSKGVDLDAIFDPYAQGASPGLTGIRSAGTDINTRYAPLVYGTAAPATGIACKVGGTGAFVDLNTLFAAYGTARYALPIDGQTFTAYSSGNVTSAMLASVTVNIKADGTYSVVCVGNQTTTTTQLGNWLPSGASNTDYQVQFGYVQTFQESSGPATFTNSAATYAACTADQSLVGSAEVGQLSALAKGGNYTVTISLKRVSTGAVTTTTIYESITSVGTG